MNFYLFTLIIFIIFDVLIYRIAKQNLFIDYIKISLPLFILLQIIFFEYYKIENNTKIFLLINYFLFLFAYNLFFTGIKKTSPSLFIINQLKKKNNSFKKIKVNFFRKNFFLSRYKENLNMNLIGINKNKIYLKKKGTNILSILNLLMFFFKIK